jgi:hypothetical protein
MGGVKKYKEIYKSITYSDGGGIRPGVIPKVLKNSKHKAPFIAV